MGRGRRRPSGEEESKIRGKKQMGRKRCRAGLGREMGGERQKLTEIKGLKRWSELEEDRCKEPRGREDRDGERAGEEEGGGESQPGPEKPEAGERERVSNSLGSSQTGCERPLEKSARRKR